jgi:single-strand DNA-binding protein
MANLNINKVILGGRLTADPELRQTPSGIAVLSFTIAVNRRFASKSTDDNGQQTQTQQADFINCVAWRQTAEFISRYFRRGSCICITGSIQTRSYNDQQGQKRYATDVQVDEAYFVDAKGEGPQINAQPYGGGYQQAPYGQAPQYGAGQYGGQNQFASAPAQDNYSAPSFASQPDMAGQFEEVASDDDLPF